VQDYEGFGLKWKPLDEFNVEVGLTKVPITNEWRTSSKEIITIERSDFINTAIPNKLGGVIANGKISDGFTKDGKFTYGAGVYTATRDDDWAYPTFDGGSVIYSGIGYEFNKNHKLRYDNSFLVGNTDAPTNATKPYAYTSALSYSGKFLDKKLSFDSDLVMAIGEDSQADLFGVILLPSYKLTEQIELVARYQYLVSNDDNGVSLQSRYERRASDLPTSKGNNYHALYGGVNYYIYKDKLKLMGGLEYSHMDLYNKGSFNQMTLFGAVRFYF
jgi:phosphate-selective porin OprO and OprP